MPCLDETYEGEKIWGNERDVAGAPQAWAQTVPITAQGTMALILAPQPPAQRP